MRIDMSEYMEKHSVARLIGAPPGYVGYEEGGALTEAVRRRPYQVVLFDEIEKAHPDVFNVLLQVLDDGRLTDGQGHTVDFRNTLIVMTSNLGAEFLVDQPEGQDTDAVQGPGDGGGAGELPARVPQPRRRDHPVPSAQARPRWAASSTSSSRRLQKLLDERKIAIALDAAAREWLADKGYDPAYGARPLKRAIQKALQDPLAELILPGSVKDGDTVDGLGDQAGPGLQRQGGAGGVAACAIAHDTAWRGAARRAAYPRAARRLLRCARNDAGESDAYRCAVRVADWVMIPSSRSRSLSKPASAVPSSTRPRGSLIFIGSTKRPLTMIS